MARQSYEIECVFTKTVTFIMGKERRCVENMLSGLEFELASSGSHIGCLDRYWPKSATYLYLKVINISVTLP